MNQLHAVHYYTYKAACSVTCRWSIVTLFQAQMHEQDSLLFKQLTDIQRSMNTLGNGRYRRSYSSADYLSQRARCRYPALLRSCSEPVFPADMPAGFASVDESEPSEAGETEEDYQNVLLESFSSTGEACVRHAWGHHARLDVMITSRCPQAEVAQWNECK